MSQSFGKLYTYIGNARGDKCCVVAKLTGLELDVVNITLPKDNRTPQYLSKFPLGKVPGFEGSDGYLLSESSAICLYLCANAKCDHKLTSKDPKMMASIMKWILIADSDLSHVFFSVFLPHLGVYSKIDHSDHKTLNSFKKVIAGIENSIKHNKTKYLVADYITLADLCLFAIFNFIYGTIFTEGCAKKYYYIDRWYKSMFDEPSVSLKYTNGYKLCAQSGHAVPSEISSYLASDNQSL